MSRFIEDKTSGDLFRLDPDHTWEAILPHQPKQVSEQVMETLLGGKDPDGIDL